MNSKCINLYLNDCLVEYEINYSRDRYITDALNFLLVKGLDMSNNEMPISWNEIRNNLIGVKNKKEDDRSAEEIINDTFKKHNIKVVE